jgi:hypothetical protein
VRLVITIHYFLGIDSRLRGNDRVQPAFSNPVLPMRSEEFYSNCVNTLILHI